MKKILFMGDSITCAGRTSDSDCHLGYGYATLISAALGHDKPNCYIFQNRGVGGNRVTDILARIKKDIINLAPDYMSILIGVNDVWHEMYGRCDGVEQELFEQYYDMLISQIIKSCPNTKIMIIEPFLLHGTATDGEWDTFRAEVEKRAEAAKRISDKFDLPFVPLMKRFDDAATIASPEHWTLDGVHPTASGHEIIKRAWLDVFCNTVEK